MCTNDPEWGESNRVRPNLDPVLMLLQVVWLRRHDAKPPSFTLALGDNLNFTLKERALLGVPQ